MRLALGVKCGGLEARGGVAAGRPASIPASARWPNPAPVDFSQARREEEAGSEVNMEFSFDWLIGVQRTKRNSAEAKSDCAKLIQAASRAS